MTTLPTDANRLIAHLHRGGSHRFTQNLAGKINASVWSRVDEPLKLPALDGNENLFFSVSPTFARITQADRIRYPDKTDDWIEQRVTSKNSTVAAINCAYAEFDGKDFTTPTDADIAAQMPIVQRQDQERIANALQQNPTALCRPQSDKALHNQAHNRAKDAIYRADRAKYDDLALAHVSQLRPAPSVIVFSGGGYQAYWLLAETLAISGHPDDHSAHVQSYAADLQARWVAFVGGDPGAHDLRRILRLPGFANHKPKYAPDYPLVSFVRTNFDTVYQLSDLAAQAPPEPRERPQAVPTARKAVQDHTAQRSVPSSGNGDGDPITLIDHFNRDVPIRDILRNYGYTDQGDRMIRPGGASPSVQINDEKNASYHHSSSDPLANGHLRTPFDILCEYDHNGNVKLAVDALAKGFFGAWRLAVRTTSFEEFVQTPEDSIYRHDAVDTKVATAILVKMEKTRRLTIKTSYRRLAKLAGIGWHGTVQKALLRLDGWFIDLTLEKTGNGCVVSLIKNVVWTRSPTFEYHNTSKVGDLVQTTNANDIYTEKMGDEPFLGGTSRYTKTQAQKVAEVCEVSVIEALRDYTFKAFGESGLRVIDALQRAGDMTTQELTEETGKKLSTIQRACQRLEKHKVLEATREGARGPKTYSLAPDHWKIIDELAPSLRTYTLSSQRENKRLEKSQVFASQAIEYARENNDPEYALKMQARFDSLAKKRLPHLRRLHDDLPEVAIQSLAYDVQMPNYDHPAAAARLQNLHEKARLETMGNEAVAVAKVITENPEFIEGLGTRQKLAYLHRAAKTDVAKQRRIDLEAVADGMKQIVWQLRDDAIRHLKGKGKRAVRARVRENLGFMGYTVTETAAAMAAAGLTI